MIFQYQTPIRMHNFYVSYLKHLFAHPEFGLVYVNNPPLSVREAEEEYSLQPIILYGLTLPGLPISLHTFSLATEPRALKEVLLHLWSNGPELRGQPDILKISSKLAKTAPRLTVDLAQIGVRVETAEANDRSLPACLAAAQKFQDNFIYFYDPADQDPTKKEMLKPTKFLEYYSSEVHHSYLNRNSDFTPKQRELVKSWRAMPFKKTKLSSNGELDWNPGPWLAYWTSSSIDGVPRYFYKSKTRENFYLANDEQLQVQDDDQFPETFRNLIACWPNPPEEIADCLGITVRKLTSLGRKAIKNHDIRFELEDLLNIFYSIDERCYLVKGPCVLVARRISAVEFVYYQLTNGGDARPTEILPGRGAADPSWRYILINPFGQAPSFIMFPGGEKISEKIHKITSSNGSISVVTREFYQDVVSTCAKACRHPRNNLPVIAEFADRYKEFWENGFWDPNVF
ncbi:MAG: hypothetical protein LBO05_09360 [Deltaproteobacteria bacterium]|nr:hypothetical protein [Deltaproteobacteria bacterium]